MNIEQIKQKILPILRPYQVKKVGLFGSCVRGDMRKGSDVDILVDIAKDISLIDFVKLKLELEEVLGTSVDLVEYSTLKPILKNNILKEQVVLL